MLYIYHLFTPEEIKIIEINLLPYDFLIAWAKKKRTGDMNLSGESLHMKSSTFPTIFRVWEGVTS